MGRIVNAHFPRRASVGRKGPSELRGSRVLLRRAAAWPGIEQRGQNHRKERYPAGDKPEAVKRISINAKHRRR